MFEQHIYTVNEADETVQLVLVLSIPSSTDITVEVFSTEGSATGKQVVTYSHQIIIL